MTTITRRTVMKSALAAPVAMSTAAGASEASRIKVLTWNIWRGGSGAGAGNLPLLLDRLVMIRPDIYLAVETYGAGPRIERALTERAGKGRYTGVQITQADPGEDNLWIFTHLPIVDVLPLPTGGEVITDFNLGGIRVRLPHRRELDAFVFWSNYTDPWDGYLIDENAEDIQAGKHPRHSERQVIRAGRVQTQHVREAIEQHLPRMRGGYDGPVLLGGDFNTLAAADWSSQWASCPSHYGMSYALTATKVLTDAGWTDTFRAARPNACTANGWTWSPIEEMTTPQRIDLILGNGGVEPVGAYTINQRLAEHGDGTFYSDHAAVVAKVDVS